MDEVRPHAKGDVFLALYASSARSALSIIAT